VVFKGLLYTRDLNNEMLRVFDIRDGKMVYEQKLDWLGSSLTFAPFVVAGGNLYINSSMKDRTIIIKPGREYVEVARNVRGIKKQDLHGWAADSVCSTEKAQCSPGRACIGGKVA
jgi:hypothetical protein